MKLKKYLLVLLCFFFTLSSYSQSFENVYQVLESVINNNLPPQGQTIHWGNTTRASNTELLVRQKSPGNFYVTLYVNGKFGYGGYFKYVDKKDNEFRYIRTDGTANDYLYFNKPLSSIAKERQRINSTTMKMINYDTSYGILLKF